MDNEVLLKVENLRQYFTLGVGKNRITVKAIHNVSFDIKKGEVVGLVGESGCGKTTTGRSIINLYKITDGDIYFKGVHIAAGTRKYVLNIKDKQKELKKELKEVNGQMKAIKSNKVVSDSDAKVLTKLEEEKQELIKNAQEYIKEQKQLFKDAKLINTAKFNYEGKQIPRQTLMNKMQMIFQDPISSLNPRMTVFEIIAEGLRIQGIKDQNLIAEKVYEALKLVGLVPDHASRYPHEFSGGQRQRIGIARSLVVSPDLIIADEPISALDVSIQAQVMNLLNELREKLQLTILFIAHDLSVVKYFCDRINVMYNGRIVESASSQELFKNPLHPYTRSLLSAIPIPDPEIEKKRERIAYNPLTEHQWSKNKPEMVEVIPGHFVYGTPEEIADYRKRIQ